MVSRGVPSESEAAAMIIYLGKEPISFIALFLSFVVVCF